MASQPWAERPENKANRLLYMAQWRRDNPLKACIHALVNGARQRARARGMNLDLEVISVPGLTALLADDMKCPCCRAKMVARVEKGKHPRAISLDRVDNDKGYVVGNVAIICATCNSRKKDMSIHDLRLLVRYVENHGTL